MLISIQGHLPDDHFLLFHNISPKEESLVKWLDIHADTRKIDTLWKADEWKKRYDLQSSVITTVLDHYRSHESQREKDDTNRLLGHDIAQTLGLVDILESSGKKLQTSGILELCNGYGGDTMFALVDAIMLGDTHKSLSILSRIKSINRVDEWASSLIGLLRNHLYIKYLKSLDKSEPDTSRLIPVHPFVLKKSYGSRISYQKLRDFYQKLILANIAYKRGKGLKDNEL